MLNADVIPKTASLQEEKNGVKWYRQGEGANSIHFIQFEGKSLQGAWCGPHWVFWAVSAMTADERATYPTHDAFMGAIRRRLIQRQSGVRDRSSDQES